MSGLQDVADHSMWMTYAVNAFQGSITGNLSAFITSDFSAHSLIPTIGIVANIMSAAAYMIMAKVLNLWDRTYGYIAMTVCATIGLILSATCKDVYTYAAAQVSLITQTIAHPVFLLGRFHRYHLFRRRRDHRHIFPKRSRFCLCFYRIAMDHRCLCRSKDF